MNRALIVAEGYLGDTLFAASAAQELRQSFNAVDLAVGFEQAKILHEHNPYIEDVYVGGGANLYEKLSAEFLSEYEQVYVSPRWSYREAPATEMKMLCGLKDTSPSFHVYLPIEESAVTREAYRIIREREGKPIVAVARDWEKRAYDLTSVNTKNPWGRYMGRRRNISEILSHVDDIAFLVHVGLAAEENTHSGRHELDKMRETLRRIAEADLFIGAEGGLMNIAAGLGVRCVYTTDFVHYHFGPEGTHRQVDDPKLGAVHYFPQGGHFAVPPHASDTDIAVYIEGVLAERGEL